MIERSDGPRHTKPEHYLWCASKNNTFDPTVPAAKWDTAWRALREAAGLRGLRFHDLRHTVVTRLLEAGEPDHVVESITGHLSRRMLEHYSHIRLTAKSAALDRLSEPRKRENENGPSGRIWWSIRATRLSLTSGEEVVLDLEDLVLADREAVASLGDHEAGGRIGLRNFPHTFNDG
jgi:hypothetical protein